MKKILFSLCLIVILVSIAPAQRRKSSRSRTSKPKVVYVASAPKVVYVPVPAAPVEPREVTRSIVVPAGNYWVMPLNVPAQGFRVNGRFQAQGGGGNDIEMFVLDADGFENWKNGHTVNTFFNSGRLTVKSFDFCLAQGQYFLIFNNKFSWLTPKAVTVTFYDTNQ